MAVSINGHNEEAVWRPVDKIKLVDMLENHSKAGETFAGKRPEKNPIERGERTTLFCVSTTRSG
jgi:hypothetical protein